MRARTFWRASFSVAAASADGSGPDPTVVSSDEAEYAYQDVTPDLQDSFRMDVRTVQLTPSFRRYHSPAMFFTAQWRGITLCAGLGRGP